MSEIDRHLVRTIGIISHIDAGKTTVSERMLFYAGAIRRMGEVHDGEAAMDWMEEERSRGITITATANDFFWNSHRITLIDTPGHVDFSIEVERSLRVLDGAVAVFSAVEGVQTQSETVWRQADRYGVSRICFINKIDRIGADIDACLKAIRERLGGTPVLMQLPIGVEQEFAGVIDLVRQEALFFGSDDQGSSIRREAIPAGRLEGANEARRLLLDHAADQDDALLEQILAGEEPSVESILKALRAGTISGAFQPVFLGSALRNRGIQPLLDGIVDLLPSPLDCHREIEPSSGMVQPLTLKSDPDGPLCAFAFKVVADQGRKLAYARIYSGRLREGEQLWNPMRQEQDRVSRIFRMHVTKREGVPEASAGDIVALAGLRGVLTGDVLCRRDEPILLAGIRISEPVISLAVEGITGNDRDGLIPALEKLSWEDPALRYREDEETGQLIVSGMGELHLEILISRLQREYGIAVRSGAPQVILRETVTGSATATGQLRIETEGRVEEASAVVRVEPAEGESVVISEGVAGRWGEQVAEALSGVCRSALPFGPLGGNPLINLQITLMEVATPLPEYVPRLFAGAVRRGIAEAVLQADPVLLEPQMDVEIETPAEWAGRILGSLQQKGGQVQGVDQRERHEVLRAKLPLASLFGYVTELRSLSKGTATLQMQFAGFAPVRKTGS